MDTSTDCSTYRSNYRSASPQPRPLVPDPQGRLTQTRTLPNGRQLTLRQACAGDVAMMRELMQSLSQEAHQQRFHGNIKLSNAHLLHMCRADIPRQVALVVSVQSEHGEQLIAEARSCVDTDTGECEFAVVVHDRWQRHGIATWALRALQDAGARAGVRHLHGTVMRDNTPQLALMRSLGFTCKPDRDDTRLMHAHIHLERRVRRRVWSVPPAWRDALAWWLRPASPL